MLNMNVCPSWTGFHSLTLTKQYCVVAFTDSQSLLSLSVYVCSCISQTCCVLHLHPFVLHHGRPLDLFMLISRLCVSGDAALTNWQMAPRWGIITYTNTQTHTLHHMCLCFLTGLRDATITQQNPIALLVKILKMLIKLDGMLLWMT